MTNLATFKNNRAYALAAAAKDGLILDLLSENFRDDKEIVLADVTQNPQAFKDASKRLKNDKDIFLKACMQNNDAARFIGRWLASRARLFGI